MTVPESQAWVAFFDADEFLVLKNHSSVQTFLDDYGKVGGSLQIVWQLFGTSNQTAAHKTVPVTRRFSYRNSLPDIGTKGIVRLSDLKSMETRVPNLKGKTKARAC